MNRINIFRKGDKVRITTWRGAVLYGDGYAQDPELNRKRATVDAATDRMVDITLENGQSYCLDIRCVALVKPKKRTFKQIMRSVARQKQFRKDYTLRFSEDGDEAEFTVDCTDYYTGESIEGVHFRINAEGCATLYAVTPEELLILARACQEIAAGRKEEA